MTIDGIIVLVALIGMLAALIADKMRPGMILFTVLVLFLCCGILSPKEMLEGFSNKGMITVAMLFLVSEGIRQSGALTQLIKKLLPQENTTVLKAQLRMLPPIAFISAFLNNTPVVVIFAPIIKRWAKKVKLSPTYFLIPLSYVTIFGGVCTLIGTSTNLVVHSMIQAEGMKGFSMFELGKVGIVLAILGIIYILAFSKYLLPAERKGDQNAEEENEPSEYFTEVVIGSRFPGINKDVIAFDFKRHYGAKIREMRRGGNIYTDYEGLSFREGDTLLLETDETFLKAWGESRVFMMIANGKDAEAPARKKKWFALALLAIMITGATVGELPAVQEMLPAGVKLDMFFFVSITTVIMAWTKIFPPRKYTKYISWDILITIACAFGISKAMSNSGVADFLAAKMIDICSSYGPYAVLAGMFLIVTVFTELITNNAAAALTFPLAMSLSQQMGVSPMPFLVVICMAASASFCTPIGYQTNLIVQGIGNYKFTDFVRIGLPLNILNFIVSVVLIPQIWSF